MITEQEKIIRKFEDMSLKYHNLSMLFNELSHSLEIQNKKIGEHNFKGFKEYIKTLNLDIDGLKEQAKEDINIFKNKDERGLKD
jgi:hypothetical protein